MGIAAAMLVAGLVYVAASVWKLAWDSKLLQIAILNNPSRNHVFLFQGNMVFVFQYKAGSCDNPEACRASWKAK
jgi:hypothetical protein